MNSPNRASPQPTHKVLMRFSMVTALVGLVALSGAALAAPHGGAASPKPPLHRAGAERRNAAERAVQAAGGRC